MEVWRDIPDYEGIYQVSDLGNVKSLARSITYHNGTTINTKEKILKPRLGGRSNGKYYSVVLHKNNKEKQMKIHRLVAMLFCENSNPELFDTVHHKDNNRLNNVSENLEWTTVEQNNKYRHDQGRSKGAVDEKNRNCKLKDHEVIEIINLLKTTNLTQAEIANMYNVGQTAISKIKLNKRKI